MIVSLADIKQFIGVSEDGFDAIITTLITSAEDELVASTGIDLLTTIRLETEPPMVWFYFCRSQKIRNT